MIVDDHHALAAILSFEVGRPRERPTTPGPPLYLDARVPATMHLRLVSALHKPTGGRLNRVLQAVDIAHRAALLEAIAAPRAGSVEVLDDRPVAGAIGALTAEPGVSVAFGAVIAHAQNSGQPILIDPANVGRWMAVVETRHIEVVTVPANVRR
ncbi:MAG: hypothetical protein ACRDY7_05760 [Acidimicrobiia bacterium]